MGSTALVATVAKFLQGINEFIILKQKATKNNSNITLGLCSELGEGKLNLQGPKHSYKKIF